MGMTWCAAKDGAGDGGSGGQWLVDLVGQVTGRGRGLWTVELSQIT